MARFLGLELRDAALPVCPLEALICHRLAGARVDQLVVLAPVRVVLAHVDDDAPLEFVLRLQAGVGNLLIDGARDRDRADDVLGRLERLEGRKRWLRGEQSAQVVREAHEPRR